MTWRSRQIILVSSLLSALNINAHNLEETWKPWEQRFDLYLLASLSGELPEKLHVAKL